MGVTHSRFQKEIFAWVQRAEGNLSVNAVAGAGKTSTIVEAAKSIPVSAKSVFLAFNKSIAEELQRRLPPHVRAMTTHSLCYRALQGSVGKMRLDSDLLSKRMQDLLSMPEKQLRGQIRKMVAMCKASGMVPDVCLKYAPGALVHDTPEFWDELLARYSIDFENDWQEETAIDRARGLLRMSIDNRDKTIDFDDMLYLPVVLNLPFPKHDWVVVDEAQDLNAIQHEVISRIVKPTGHVVAVGDPRQSIYLFRGSMSDSMAILRDRMKAKELPLSICYRCAKAIIAEAKPIVPQIEAPETAEDGTVSYRLPPQEALAEFTPDAAVLSPFNAPLIKAAYQFIRLRVACRILGRDIGEGLVKLVEKLERDGAANVKQIETALQEYYYDQAERLQDKEAQLAALADKVETLGIFLSELPGTETVERLISEIKKLFVEETQGMLTLSSIHRAKGLEWDKVFLLDSEALSGTMRNGKPLSSLEMEQRRNLLYVGITRARKHLVYITSEMVKQLHNE